ncbi:MAG: hypothetical protein H6Q76_1755 [Firmicutes bacterium]|nr:hypothetical protein [Bacillota bacterium]
MKRIWPKQIGNKEQANAKGVKQMKISEVSEKYGQLEDVVESMDSKK